MSKRLFVGNLSFDINEAQLQETFAPYGCTGATIPANENGRPKGFGFVDVADDQAAAAIAAMEGKELGGRNIAVSEAKPRPEVNTWGSGGGGRGGYGGRGGFGGGGGGRGGYGGGRGGFGGGGGRGGYGGGGGGGYGGGGGGGRPGGGGGGGRY